MSHSHLNDRPAMAGQDTAPVVHAVLIPIHDVARLLNCSVRHVYRLVDARRIPRPIKLGAILRWVRADFEQWIADGCPDCRKGGTR